MGSFLATVWKRILYRYFSTHGMHVITEWLAQNGMKACSCHDAMTALQTLAKFRKEPVRTMIDVGASDGRWCREALAVFPQAAALLVEANTEHKAALETFCREYPSSRMVLAAAGEKRGTAKFSVDGLFGGVLQTDGSAVMHGHTVDVPIIPLDDAVAEAGMTGPYLLKLDTHGAELPILSGASAVLSQATLVIIEAYNFPQSHPSSIRFHQMCEYMEGRGFRCADLCGVQHRPRDGALWQMDLYFLKDTHPSFASSEYA